MNYKLIILTNQIIEEEKPVLITESRAIFKQLKTLSSSEKVSFKLNFESLNLGQVLYGNSKQESAIIQKKNAKIVLKFYSVIKKVVKLAKKLQLNFDGTFYVDRLDEKKNNNDFIIESLLDIDFNGGNKYEKIISHASDFLAKENAINNMCDFKDNKCVSCRERNIDRVIGCCQKNCKFTHTGTCTVKNIACKLYMCDYQENRGYHFSPYHHPILKRYFNIIQRFICTALLFKSLEYQVKALKITKWVSVFVIWFAVISFILRTILLFV